MLQSGRIKKDNNGLELSEPVSTVEVNVQPSRF